MLFILVTTITDQYVGILCNLKGHQVELNFLQQGNIGKNIFSNEEDDIQTVKSSDVVYKLVEAPNPVSASSLSNITLNETDFKEIESRSTNPNM